MPHRLDPPIQTQAARTFGKLIAQGIVAYDDVLPDLYRAAIKAGYTGDRRGLRTRLAWHLREAADFWQIERSKADWPIREAIAPLVEAREPAEAIMARAHAANEARGEPLLRSEVRGLVREVLQAALIRMDRKAGRRRHV